MSRYSPEEKRARRKKRKAERVEFRSANRRFWAPHGRSLHRKLARIITSEEAGLSRPQISQFSGADPSTISRFMNGKIDSIRMSTFVAIAGACGYNVVLEKMPPEEDSFYKFRRFKPPPIEKE